MNKERFRQSAITVDKKKTLYTSMLLSVVMSLASCSPKIQSVLGSDINVGVLPDDICMVDGQPKILNVSTESQGDIYLIYVRKNGDIVSQHYSTDITTLGSKFKPRGSLYWTGGNCPPSTR